MEASSPKRPKVVRFPDTPDLCRIQMPNEQKPTTVETQFTSIKSANSARRLDFVTKVRFGDVNIECRARVNVFKRKSKSLGNLLEEFKFQAVMEEKTIKLAKSVADIHNLGKCKSKVLARFEMEQFIWKFLYASKYADKIHYAPPPPAHVDFLTKSDDFYSVFSHICHAREVLRFRGSAANYFNAVPEWIPFDADYPMAINEKVSLRSALMKSAMNIDRTFLNSDHFKDALVKNSGIRRSDMLTPLAIGSRERVVIFLYNLICFLKVGSV